MIRLKRNRDGFRVAEFHSQEFRLQFFVKNACTEFYVNILLRFCLNVFTVDKTLPVKADAILFLDRTFVFQRFIRCRLGLQLCDIRVNFLARHINGCFVCRQFIVRRQIETGADVHSGGEGERLILADAELLERWRENRLRKGCQVLRIDSFFIPINDKVPDDFAVDVFGVSRF